MSREIKYRAFDKERKIMTPSDTLEKWIVTLHSGCPSPLIERFMSTHLFLLYTGLKDENGVEIYEGDIVEPVPNAVIKYQVIYDDKTARFILRTTDKYELDVYGLERVVIGNIYENPELLEVK